MKELLEYIMRSLVDNPEAITIRERSNRHTITYEVSVHPKDTGKIIGRNGRVAKAVRDVMSVAAARNNKRVHVDIK
jgi:hypothetical protein